MIAAIVLAAGAARRMGKVKQLLPLAGQPLVRWVVDIAVAAGAAPVILVTGHQGQAVAAAVADQPVTVVQNENWQRGMASSLRAGVAALPADCRAVILMLADQPLVRAETVRAIITAYQAGTATIVAPFCGGRRGHPVLFDLSRWREPLLLLSGDVGARQLLAENPDEIKTISLFEEMSLWDADTEEDYQQILAYARSMGWG